jgi:hypothetical protein
MLPFPRIASCPVPVSSTAPAVAIADVDLKIPLNKASDAAPVSTIAGEVLATKETGTYVLKPFRSPKSKKLKTAVVFVPRLSHFDIDNERSNKNEFRVRPQPFSAYTTLTHSTHSMCNHQKRGFSRSFGSQSSYGRSARISEVWKHRAHRSTCGLPPCSQETRAHWRSVTPHLS